MKRVGNILLISGEGRKTGSSDEKIKNDVATKNKDNLRLRLLSSTKLVISL